MYIYECLMFTTEFDAVIQASLCIVLVLLDIVNQQIYKLKKNQMHAILTDTRLNIVNLCWRV